MDFTQQPKVIIRVLNAELKSVGRRLGLGPRMDLINLRRVRSSHSAQF